MSNVKSSDDRTTAADPAEQNEFVSFTVGDQLFGIPVLSVQDVLQPQSITPVHRAPPEIAGSLNLRGRIVTAVDIRRRLGMAPTNATKKTVSVVVEQNGDLYSLIVDAVGDVLSLSSSAFEANPTTLDPQWREVSRGVFRLKERLLVILEIGHLLNFGRPARAV